MKIALVHDYLNEYGGAERVLEVLAEMYPEAPIFTAFYKKGSKAYEYFKDRKVIPSWAQRVPGFVDTLHSPLRFLAPQIWESFDLDEYDVVISSASWYITKGVLTQPETVHICYCHTPPRYLYGYDTSINYKKYWPMRLYAGLVNKGLRQYDYLAAQRVDHFVANSKNVAARIKKFYGRDSTVIYPPVQLHKTSNKEQKDRNYFLVVSRVVGAKGLEMAVRAANELAVPLKVVGRGSGYSQEEERLKKQAGKTVEFLGFVDDEKLAELYAGARALLARARDEDFGITPVEAMMAGTPVIAFEGGGYRETVVDGKTGILFDDYSATGLIEAMQKLQGTSYKEHEAIRHAQQFSKERFVKEMGEFVEKKYNENAR